MLSREQLYLDLLFSKLSSSCTVRAKEGLQTIKGKSSLVLNNSPSAGSTLGFKHKPEFGFNRSGLLNPMTGRNFSP
jgi:hypothetical protein